MFDPICERHLAIDRLAKRDFGRLGLSRTRERAPLRGRQRRSLRSRTARKRIASMRSTADSERAWTIAMSVGGMR
jgi:hypothetical protein